MNLLIDIYELYRNTLNHSFTFRESWHRPYSIYGMFVIDNNHHNFYFKSDSLCFILKPEIEKWLS